MSIPTGLRRIPQVRRPLAVAAVLGITALTAGSAGVIPAFADGNGTSTGDVAVTNTETVQIYTDADGKIDSKRVYEQLTLSGHGSVALANPVSTDGLRNLDGFGGFTVRDGDQMVDTSVDGEKALRSVSTYTGTSPLSVAVHYTLDGKPVSAGDIVGRSGHLKVTYVVTNTSGTPTPLTYSDGNGGTVTKTVDVPIPMVASLALTTPDTYRNVTSKDANMGGDGHGGMMLSFTMTLLPPVGPATSSVSYEADITDGVVPRAELTALPVDPLTNPTFASAAKQYKSGSDQGDQLTDGALKLDAGLLKLHGGAAQLLAGLIKLHDGASQLRAGLQGQAAPGSQQLAAGLDQLAAGTPKLHAGATQINQGMQQLDTGATKLNSGASQLNSGASQLHDGTGAALDGGKQLAAGLSQLVAGLNKLAGTPTSPGLTAAPSALQAALSSLNSLETTLGSASDCSSAQACGILGGLATLDDKISDAKGAAGTDASSVDTARSEVDAGQQALQDALRSGGTLDDLGGRLDDLGTDCAGDEGCLSDVAAAKDLAATLRTDMTTGQDGLDAAAGQLATTQQLVADLDAMSTTTAAMRSKVTLMQAVLNGVISSLTSFEGQVEDAVVGLVGDPLHPHKAALLPGAKAARDGAEQLADGLTQLNSGTGRLLDGTGQLLTGTGQLKTGSGKLLAGSSLINEKLGEADAGAQKLDAGAHQLADGLGTAADGSGQLDDGLGQAAAGAPKLVAGTKQASTQGSQKIAAAGEQTAQQFGLMYAELDAEARRAHDHAMAYGAPKGAIGLTAYDWIIQGADGHDSREVKRGLMLGGVLALGAGGLLARRRFLG